MNIQELSNQLRHVWRKLAVPSQGKPEEGQDPSSSATTPSSPTAAVHRVASRVVSVCSSVSQQVANYASAAGSWSRASAESNEQQPSSSTCDVNPDQACASSSPTSQQPAHEALLLPEIMTRVFSFMTDCPRELLRSHSLVCRVWRDAARAPELWRPKLQPSVAELNHTDLPSLGPDLPAHSLWLALHGRNFLRNPCFCKSLNMDRAAWSQWRRNAWVVTTAGGNGVSWEQPPVGMEGGSSPPPPLPYPQPGAQLPGLAGRVQSKLQGLLAPDKPTCLATSYDWAEVVQVVDMVEELGRRGLSREQACAVLDCGAALGFTLQVGGRVDCPSTFAAGVQLDEGEGADVPSIQSFVMKPGRHHFYTHRLDTAPGAWRRFAYLVDPCPKGFRRATIILRGRDKRAWAGHYGAKFTCAQLSFVAPHEKEGFMACMQGMDMWK